jgi:hypothetical protein
LKTTGEYLQEKHQPAVEQDWKKEKKGKEVLKLPLLIQKEAYRQESRRGS